MIRTIIVDDEPPARRRLRALLETQPDVEVLAECGSSGAAIEAVERHRPDLVFLDIQMPGGDGFDVVAALRDEPAPAIVFVTAFSEHAVRAFDVDAIDYLLKPFDRERLWATLDRVRARPCVWPRVRDRLPIKVGDRIHLLDQASIDYLRAEQRHVRIHVGHRSHLVRDTLAGLEHQLDATAFLRVHRSVIVRLDRIRELEVLSHGEFQLRLTTGETLLSGRAYRERLREAFGLPL